jgi:hypothetical protein
VSPFQALNAPGLTRQHAAINCLAASIDGTAIAQLRDQELSEMLLALVSFASRDNYQSALLEWADERLAFQAKYNLMERNALERASLTNRIPRSGFHFFTHTKANLRHHLLMIRENALRLAGRIIMADDRFDVVRCSYILEGHPKLIHQLLDLALLPRSSSSPHCELDSLAMFVLSRFMRAPGPHGCASWMERDLVDGLDIVPMEHWTAFNHSLRHFRCFGSLPDKLIKSLTEASEGYDRLVSWVP